MLPGPASGNETVPDRGSLHAGRADPRVVLEPCATLDAGLPVDSGPHRRRDRVRTAVRLAARERSVLTLRPAGGLNLGRGIERPPGAVVVVGRVRALAAVASAPVGDVAR